MTVEFAMVGLLFLASPARAQLAGDLVKGAYGLTAGTQPPPSLVVTPWIYDSYSTSLVGPDGATLPTNGASTTAFIAMAFGLSNAAQVAEAISKACSDNDWDGKRIDQRHFTGSIMDRVLAEINRARFVVADFTRHNRGVYFEAGYAEGLGIQVIYTVWKGHVRRLHFDTRHINHIAWDTPDDLRADLTARIGAVINRPK